jgi:hypothetical protein
MPHLAYVAALAIFRSQKGICTCLVAKVLHVTVQLMSHCDTSWV